MENDSMSKQFELQSDILDGTDTGIYVIDSDSYELYMANQAAFRIMGVPLQSYRGRKCYEVMAGRSQPCVSCMFQSGSEKAREMYTPSRDKIVAMTAKQTRWMDRAVTIGYLSDITARKEAERELKLGGERLAAALRHAGVQFWEYDILNDRAYMSEFSQQSYRLPAVMDNFPRKFLDLGYVHPDDVQKYLDLHKRLKNGAKSGMLEYRVNKPGEGYCWLLCHYTNSFDPEGRPVRAYATGENIQRYKEQEEQFTVASGLTGTQVWTLDLQQQQLRLSESDAAQRGVNRVLSCRTREELQSSGMIFADDMEESWKRYRELFEGAESASFRVRLRTNGEYRWNRVSYTVLRSKGGLPVKAVGTSIDIHEHVLLEQRFEQELDYSAGLQAPNLISKAQSNLTKGTVDMYAGDENAAISYSGASYEESAWSLAMSAVEQETQQQIHYLLNRKRVMDAYARGEHNYSIEYQRRGKDGTVFWVSMVARTYQNPSTGDIMSFIYTYNIDEQKTVEAIIHRVVDTNFEYLTLFSTVTGLVEKTIDKAGVKQKPEQGSMYGESVAAGLRRILAPGEGEEYLGQFAVENIAARLDKNGTYSISMGIMDNGKPRHKLWVYNWFDKTHTKILCTRSDITEVHGQEQKQKETLSVALAAARQANAAKSDFLSRMSHEIRTPMNAIIGMTAIAARSLGNEEQLSDCISKIDISSRFLLSLINDILDMSRIESGKMLLKRERFSFRELAAGVNTICHTQAAAKAVEYQCRVDPLIDEYYIGDAMKLEQVLVNIIGNAVKFTGSGGRVTFAVDQRRRTENDAVLRFVVKDTGIGMSQEFLPRLFKPFEQESTGITVGYGGTGLGLAISKNIVDMMDGRIQVRSVRNEGTEFTVEVKLGITGEEKRRALAGLPDLKEGAEAPAGGYDFSGRRLLLVEDQPINEEIAQLLLEDVGFTVESAENGLRAVERFSEAGAGYYDAILMDIRMPVMDGLQAAAHIRQLPGADAGTIPIIAMTADAFDEDADKCKAAGMNRHLSKPIDPPGLYRTLYEILLGNRNSSDGSSS